MKSMKIAFLKIWTIYALFNFLAPLFGRFKISEGLDKWMLTVFKNWPLFQVVIKHIILLIITYFNKHRKFEIMFLFYYDPPRGPLLPELNIPLRGLLARELPLGGLVPEKPRPAGKGADGAAWGLFEAASQTIGWRWMPRLPVLFPLVIWGWDTWAVEELVSPGTCKLGAFADPLLDVTISDDCPCWVWPIIPSVASWFSRISPKKLQKGISEHRILFRI